MSFVTFLASGIGRAIRIIVGAILMFVGLILMQGMWGYVVALIGLVPLVAGVLNVCLIAPLIGAPFNGRMIHQH